MKKLTALLTGVVLMAIINLNAQDLFKADPYSRSRRTRNDQEYNYTHNLGFAAGFTTGYGLSYRFWPKKLGVQITFAPFNNDEISQYSAGLTLFWRLAETNCADLFIYESTHFFYRQEYESYAFYNFHEDSPIRRQVNCGFGAGVEFKLGKRVGYDLMIGYAGYRGFKKVNLTAETGLYFKF